MNILVISALVALVSLAIFLSSMNYKANKLLVYISVICFCVSTWTAIFSLAFN